MIRPFGWLLLGALGTAIAGTAWEGTSAAAPRRQVQQSDDTAELRKAIERGDFVALAAQLDHIKQTESYEAAVAVLAAGLASPAVKSRALSAYGLAELGEAARRAAPQLRGALNDEDVLVRFHAARAVWKTARDAKAALKPMKRALAGEKSPQAAMAVEVLVEMAGEYPPATAAVVDALDHPNRAVRAAAADGLGRIAQVDLTVVPALWKALDDSDAGVRRMLHDRLGKLRQQPPAAVPAIVAQTTSGDAETRALAYRALRLVEDLPAAGVEALCRGLKERSPEVREHVYQSLYRQRPAAEVLVPAVIAALKDEKVDFSHDQHVYTLRGLLADLREQAAPIVPALIQGIADGRVGEDLVSLLYAHREVAAKSLPVLIPALRAALGDDDPIVRRAVLHALDRVEATDEETQAAVRRIVQGAPGPDRGVAAVLLRKITGGAEPELNALFAFAKDPEQRTRATVVAYLGQLSQQRQEVLPVLLEAIQDRNPQVRVAAIGALHALSANATVRSRVVAALEAARYDELDFVRAAAQRALDLLSSSAASKKPQE